MQIHARELPIIAFTIFSRSASSVSDNRNLARDRQKSFFPIIFASFRGMNCDLITILRL